MKVANVLAISGYVGITISITAYGYGIYAGIESAGALALMGFGLGSILGIFIANRLWSEKPQPRPVQRPVGTKPVEILWRDENSSQITHIRKLHSVTDMELRAVAVKVIHGGANITFRGLRGELSEQTIADLQAELVEKRLAHWRSYDDRGQPNRTQGIQLTDEGLTVMREALRQAPYPSYGTTSPMRVGRVTHTR